MSDDPGYFDRRTTEWQYAPGTQGAEAERNTRSILRVLYERLPVVIAALVLLWFGRIILGWFLYAMFAILVLWITYRVLRHKGTYREAIGRLIAGWRKDWPRLIEYLSLAFRREKDERTLLAMAHTQHFLAGRIMSPLRLVAGFLAVTTAIATATTLWFWRDAEASARKRDEACSAQELAGRTTRQACADLTEARNQRDQYAQAHGRVLATLAERDAQLETERQAHQRAMEDAARRATAAVNLRERDRRRSIERESQASGAGRIDPVERLRSLAAASRDGDGDTGDASAAAAAGAPSVLPLPGGLAGPEAAGELSGDGAGS